MRRGGWAVHMVPGLRGSYEESAADAHRPRGARPALVPGQPAAPGGAAGARAALDQPAASADRHRLLPHRAAVAAVPPHRHPDRAAGALRAAGLLPRRASRCSRNGRSIDPVRSTWVFVGTMAVLLAPKLLGYLALLLRRAERRGCGGALRPSASLLIEVVWPG